MTTDRATPAAPARTAADVAASVDPRTDYPTYISCSGKIKAGGVVEDDGAWLHEICRSYELRRGGVR